MGNKMATSSTAQQSSHLIFPAIEKHTATVIMIHGLGDSGHGYPKSIVRVVRSPHVKYICPHAETQRSSVNRGMKLPSWFDIKGFKVGAEMDETGIKAAAAKAHLWIDDEIKSGTPSKRIAIAGISQGGALAIYSTFTYDKELAGIVGLSTWLLLPDQIPGDRTANLNIPVFQSHGDADPLVPLEMGEDCSEHIKKFNKNHTFKTYPGMRHETCKQELEDMKEFLDKILPPL